MCVFKDPDDHDKIIFAEVRLEKQQGEIKSCFQQSISNQTLEDISPVVRHIIRTGYHYIPRPKLSIASVYWTYTASVH